MTRFLMSAALTVAALACVSSAQAVGTNREPRSDHSRSRSDYHLHHGTKFSHGYYYKGREHRHWDSCYFDERFGCYLYHCPSTKVYYYWCERDDSYFPINYCPYDTYCFGKERVCSTCPIHCPTHRPIYSKPGGFKNTIHPIVNHNPAPPTQGIPPRGHGPVVPPRNTLPILGTLPLSGTPGNNLTGTFPTGPKGGQPTKTGKTDLDHGLATARRK